MQSHLRKVYACLAVTCHLRFWQNDRGLLRAIATDETKHRRSVHSGILRGSFRRCSRLELHARSVLKFQAFPVGQISDETKRGRSVLSEIWSGSLRRFMGQIADKRHPRQDK